MYRWSIGPGRSAKNRSRAAGSVTSKAAVPRAPTSAAACFRCSAFRPVKMTSAPSSRARRAVSRPMPELPPITTTVCPDSSGTRVMVPPYSARHLVAPQRLVELAAGADVELGEHLAQMPLHGAGPDEQLRADLGVGPPVARQPGDLPLLRGQLRARILVPLAHLLPGGQELAPGAFGEGLDTGRGQRVERDPQLAAGGDPAGPD